MWKGTSREGKTRGRKGTLAKNKMLQLIMQVQRQIANQESKVIYQAKSRHRPRAFRLTGGPGGPMGECGLTLCRSRTLTAAGGWDTASLHPLKSVPEDRLPTVGAMAFDSVA